MIQYLEEKYPQHPLLPRDLAKKAINYQAANIVASSIQPLLALPVMNYIGENVGEDAKIQLVYKNVVKGFAGKSLLDFLSSH
ncbi:glutathione S-transferase zeta class-like [Helianthus annuus]|uniref:glutathione S-transferase zeta class-like n=1 Tax=Helianthus annuus TaxID=4232 RepID=UPI0016531D99|nr:glutathione S-transferase zeta class-like [Helianthus annuus]